MYTEVHCHLLPGVDDGCETWEDSAACLDRAVAEGVSRILVTPHIRPGKYDNTPAALREAFAAWEQKAAGRGLSLALGAEVYFQHNLPEEWEAGNLLPCGEGGRYLLVELPMAQRPRGVADVFYRLRLLGVVPVLAHPERYVWAQKDPRRVSDLAESGILLQVTTHSLVGTFGPSVERAAWAMLDRGWIALAASDAHRPNARPPLFREAVRRLARAYGKTAAKALCVDNPRRLFEGVTLEAVPCRPRRRGLFGRRP